MDVIVFFIRPIAVHALTAAQVGVMGFNHKGFHPHDLAFAQVLELDTVGGFLSLPGHNVVVSLQINEHLRGKSLRRSIRLPTKVVLHRVLCLTVGG